LNEEVKSDIIIKVENDSFLREVAQLAISEFEFLNAFYHEDENVCMRVYSDRKSKKIFPKMYEFPLKEIDKYREEMAEKNLKNNCGVHFTVNYGGQYDKYIKRINAVFFENDNLSFDEQLEMIVKSPIEPSIIVKTRKSLHCYFLVDDVPVKKFRNIQERLALYFNADTQIKNESRTMRMPNFYHVKKEPILVQCVKFNPEIRYTYEDINAILPPLPKKPKKPKADILIDITSGQLDEESIYKYMRKKLEIAYERDDKMVCHCLFPDKHANGDKVPSAVFFKGKNPAFFCSGCGTYMSLYELCEKFEWNDLKEQLIKTIK
jgi:hypothetical protein